METPASPAAPDPTPPPVTAPPPAGEPPPASTSRPAGPAGPAGGAGLGLAAGDWPAQATDAIVDLVGTVRDKTTGPITTVARGVVFGFFAGVVGITIAILALIAVIRLLDEALPSGVWLPYLILGVLFVLVGALVFRKRKAPAQL